MRCAKVLAGLALIGLTVSGCATGDQQGATIMGRTSGSRAGMMSGFGAAMMGPTPPGYHLSRLSCSAPSSLPGATVFVMLGDMGMTRTMSGVAPRGQRMMLRAVPSTVPAGLVSFVVADMGWRTHEMVILPLAAGASAGGRVPGTDGQVDEAGSLGEASARCGAGAGGGLTSGSLGWVTVVLAAGRYEVVCNLPNHYADGMWQEITVT